MVGSDTWVNQRWQSYDDLMRGYRRWLGELPPALARRIGWAEASEDLPRHDAFRPDTRGLSDQV